MNARFTSKNVLVTGAGAGIGRAIALAFAREDAAVVVAGRSEEPLNQTVKLIRDGGGRATAITADVTRSEDVAALVAGTAAASGSLDVAVNNAGTLTAFGPVGDGHLRISYVSAPEVLTEALQRIRAAVEQM